MTWNNAFTIALIEEDAQKISQLLDTMPLFETIEDASQAQGLIQEALALMCAEKEKTYEAMQKLKKTRAFVASAAIIETHQKEYRG